MSARRIDMTIALHIHHDRHDAPVDPAIAALVEAFPLAWVVSRSGEATLATPLPLCADYDESGRLAAFIGHFALRNRQVEALREDSRATILFSGPSGYISPQHVAEPTWAPTWNYTVARFRARVELDVQGNDAALRRLTDKMECASGGSWTVDQVGQPKYDRMCAHIIAFRADILSCDANFKLGQDERDGDFATIVAGLGDDPLVEWMLKARG